MSETTAGRRAAEHLLRDKEAIARAVTTALYAQDPTLLERYGERGRAKCLQDMLYNVEHLIPAVDLEDEEMFAQYVRWLDGLLRARGVATRDVERCLDLMIRDARSRYEESDAALMARIIGAGAAVLGASA